MLSLITGAVLAQATSYEKPYATLVMPRVPVLNDKVHDFFSGWRDKGYTNSTVGPFCPASAHVLVDLHTMPMSESYVKFLNKKAVEISLDEAAIATLVENVNQGNFPDEMMHDPELFPIALSAGAIGAISIDDVANLRIWQQLIDDFDEKGEPSYKIQPLLDENGQWNPVALSEPYRDFPQTKLAEMLPLVQKLPKSQQVFLSGFLSDYGKLIPLKVLSLQAEQLRYKVEYGQTFSAQPRLGMKFSKKAVTNAETDDKSRLVAIPPTGTTSREARPYTRIADFTDHDRQHIEVLSRVRTSTVTAFLELITALRQVSQRSMTRQIWEFADFVYLESRDDANEEFVASVKVLWERLGKSDFTRWAIVLHIHTNAQRWLNGYGLVGARISGVNGMYEFLENSKSVLEGYSSLEKIYLLDKMFHRYLSKMVKFTDFEAAYQRELPVPPVKLSVEQESGELRVTPRDRGQA